MLQTFEIIEAKGKLLRLKAVTPLQAIRTAVRGLDADSRGKFAAQKQRAEERFRLPGDPDSGTRSEN